MLRAMAESDLGHALRQVISNINRAAAARPKEFSHFQPRLVAVAKTKPVDMIIEAYKCGQRNFGENYVAEFESKSKHPVILEQCQDIKWHFVGHLQRNKVNKILSLPNLYMIETIDSTRLANAVNTTWEKLEKAERLRVMVQVNTSGEENKHGVPVDQASNLVSHILSNCPRLELLGLMTIGAYGYDLSQGPNADFLRLVECKHKVSKELGMDPKYFEMSMGMSTDYEHAISLGSSNVRIGSTIFGDRETKAKTEDEHTEENTD